MVNIRKDATLRSALIDKEKVPIIAGLYEE
jgi:hypothetical protein